MSRSLSVLNSMSCKIKKINNLNSLHTMEKLEQIIQVIILYNNFNCLEKVTHTHDKLNLSLIYILEECHLCMKTFPETNSMEFELNFFSKCDKSNTYQIFEFLVQSLNADMNLSTLKID